MNCKNYSEDCDWLYQFTWIYTPVTLDFLRSIDFCIYCKIYSEDCDWLYQFTWIYTPVTLDFLCSIDFCKLYKNRMQKIKTCYEKIADQIEMSSAENIFGPVSKFLTPQASPRPTFSFNTGIVGRTPNSLWTPFNLMIAPIQK